MGVATLSSSSSCWMVAPWISKTKPHTTLKFNCSQASPPLPHSSSSSAQKDDLQPLLQILPSDLHHNLLNQANRPQLLEVILDLGRYPEARYLGKLGSQYLRNTEVIIIS